MELKQGTLLQEGKYTIEQVLGQGGFGITYLAKDTHLDRKICIKEFYMKEFCDRDQNTSHISVISEGVRTLVDKYRSKFIKEALLISSMNNPHIITIFDIFEENGSAYYTMEYMTGSSLKALVEQNGALSEQDALRYIAEAANALAFIHRHHVMHLDVKPSNIMIDSNDHAVLIDFGISKQYDTDGKQTSSTPVGISHGYAPIEQYNPEGVSTFSPETDIYSLGATLYYLLVGKPPRPAQEINEEGLGELPKHISRKVRQAIKHSMKPKRKDRPSSVEQLMSELQIDLQLGERLEGKDSLPTPSTDAWEQEAFFQSLLWTTYPFLWAYYRQKEGKRFRYWHLFANPLLWMMIIFPSISKISSTEFSNGYLQLFCICILALMVMGAIVFAIVLNRESKQKTIHGFHFLMDSLFAIFSLSFTNIASEIVFNTAFPLIAGIVYLRKGFLPDESFKKLFRWLSWANLLLAPFTFLIYLFILASFYID